MTRRTKSNRSLALCIPVVAASLAVAGCDLAVSDPPGDDPSPDFQDLDGGDGWETGQDQDTGGDPGTDDPGTDDPPDGGEPEEDTATDGDCLDLAWNDYQVSGTCPGLPPLGSIEQPEGCGIAIPGELGEIVGHTGTVSGSLVHTARCAGSAAILAAPKVDLVCVLDSASCTVLLNGSASNSP